MKVECPTEIRGLRRLWREAFGDTDEFLDLFFAHGFDPMRCRCIMAGGQPAAALYWLDCTCRGRTLAYIYAVATAKVHRGKGLCRALMADTHRLLAEQGCSGAVLVPGEPSLAAFYGAMGYTPCGGISELACIAAEEAASLRPLSREEFAALRRQFLPDGGVIQEGAALEFLAAQADFYAGDDFLLAFSHGAGVELLGNTAAAPGILRALGAETGCFRVPGSDPFAMYLPFDDSPAPNYFGFAFDGFCE